jgi:hypothetical protein
MLTHRIERGTLWDRVGTRRAEHDRLSHRSSGAYRTDSAAVGSRSKVKEPAQANLGGLFYTL